MTKKTEAGQVLVLMGQAINKYKKRSTRIGPKGVIVVAEGGG